MSDIFNAVRVDVGITESVKRGRTHTDNLQNLYFKAVFKNPFQL